MDLYYAVHFDHLETILEENLGSIADEPGILPMQLVIYPSFAEVACKMKNYKHGVDDPSEVVVLCVDSDSIEDGSLQPCYEDYGHAYR